MPKDERVDFNHKKGQFRFELAFLNFVFGRLASVKNVKSHASAGFSNEAVDKIGLIRTHANTTVGVLVTVDFVEGSVESNGAHVEHSIWHIRNFSRVGF